MVAQLSNIRTFLYDLAFLIARRRSAQNAADRRCGVDPITACRCNCVSNLPFGLAAARPAGPNGSTKVDEPLEAHGIATTLRCYGMGRQWISWSFPLNRSARHSPSSSVSP